MASTEAVLRLRSKFRVASERAQLGLYFIEKNDLDQDHGLGDIWLIVKTGKWPCLFYRGALYIQ